MLHTDVQRSLQKVASVKRAQMSTRFFKTGAGEYGAGDVFIGVTVPEQRKIAKQFLSLPLVEVQKLLKSEVHEYRCTALLIVVLQYQKGSVLEKQRVVAFYLRHKKQVNNWDLVDTSAYQILGEYCVCLGDADVLYTLIEEQSMWYRRIAMVATYAFIKRSELAHTFLLAERVLQDTEDLMHKATGWMLREAGKKDKRALEQFLEKWYQSMPRTMFRYAIERFSENERRRWLQKK